jgi:hypothetical protein
MGYCGTGPTPKPAKRLKFNTIITAPYLQFVVSDFGESRQGHAHDGRLVCIDWRTWMLVDRHVDAGAGRFIMGVT